ncbi:MAG: orotate phosphoribosyltransferase [Bradymonadia bacterium]
MSLPSPDRQRLLELLKALSFARRDVVLASGQSSNVYIDCKQTALHPEGAWHLGGLMLEAVQGIEARTGLTAGAVGGMTLGADPLATAVSLAGFRAGRHLPAFIVRKTQKGHGTDQWLEGQKNMPADGGVVLLEDVVTTGGSTLSALERCRVSGLKPFGVVAIVDRGAGGIERLAEEGLDVQALYRLSDFE